MGTAIGSMLGFAAGVAVSPLPIVAMILLLATPHGRATGTAFGLGWLIGLGVLGTVVLLLANPANAATGSGPAKWTGWLKLVLGVALLLFAAKQWRKRAEAGAPPKWLTSIEHVNATKAFGLGALLATVNPKNGALSIAAAAGIAATGVSGGEQAVALALFVIISSLGVLTPLVVYLIAGEAAAHVLESWRTWFIANNDVIMAVLFFVIGAKLIGDGIQVLAA